MKKYTNNFLDSTGRVVPGAIVTVTNYPAGDLAAIYATNNGAQTANPLTTDALGYFEFYAADGRYTISITSDATERVTITDVLIEDPADGVPEYELPTGSGLIGFEQAGVGTVGRTVEAKLRETVSVKDFGADESGLNSSLPAFAAAYEATAAGGRIDIPAGAYAGVNGVLTGTKFVIWQASGQPSGGGAWSLPGMVEQGFTTRKIILRQQTTPDDDGKTSFVRVADHTGGTAGFVNANVSVHTTVGATNTNFEWGLLTVLNNSAATGENCALYAQGNKLADGPTWAGVFEAADKTNLANPASGLLGLEIDVFANGTDTNNNRIGIDLVAGQANRGGANVACEAYAAVRVNRRNLAGDVGDFNFGIVINSAKIAGISLRETGRMGIDTSEATFNDGTVPNMALQMASGQRINFSASLTRTMRYEPSSTALRYATGGATLLEIGDDGSLRAGGEIRVLGTKVLGSRDTGWLAMTGTGNKSAVYDTATVTLAQLAGRVASMQAALTAHGLIGT